ncbi:MAG: hypothetical protein H7Y33_09415 [Cytophagales bacterium]|nr:hypothetical protein [Rhizobacter sp.]
MNRLQTELHRLYLPHSAAEPGADAAASSLIDPEGKVRAMVLELARPANWELLSKVWRGVQVDLELPAPAIAVSGTDGFQLWFSLSQPVSVAQAHAFLASLRARFLADVAPKRVCLMPAVDASAPRQALHARGVPAEQEQTGNWSAFVASDLAPVFADTPWLDIPPSNEGQADLLSRLESIKPPAFEAALERLRPATPADAGHLLAGAAASVGSQDAKRFLLQVMNDDTVALALRIEAAKALLPCTDEHHPDAKF